MTRQKGYSIKPYSDTVDGKKRWRVRVNIGRAPDYKQASKVITATSATIANREAAKWAKSTAY